MAGLWRPTAKLRFSGQAVTVNNSHPGKVVGQNASHRQAGNAAANNDGMVKSRAAQLAFIYRSYGVHVVYLIFLRYQLAFTSHPREA